MKRITCVGLILVLFGAGTAVFAAGTQEATAGDKEVTLRYLAPAGDKELPDIVQAFMTDYPKIKIVTEGVPGDWDNMNTKLLTTYAAGTAPDLVQVQDEPFPAFALRGIFLNLDPLIERDKDFPTDDCVYGSLNAWKMNPQTGQMGTGHQYALSWSGGIVVGYANKTLFDQAGVGYPDLKWTLGDFLSAAQKMTKQDSQGRTIQYGFEGSKRWYHDMPTFVFTFGGNYIAYDKNGEAHSVFNTPEVLEALTFLQDLFQKYKVAPIPVLPREQGLSFTGGKIGVTATGSWGMGNIRKAAEGLGFDWDIFVWPPINPAKGEKTRRTRSTFDGVAIIDGTKNPDAAWQWLRYVAVGNGQVVMAKTGTYQPVVNSMIKSDYWARPETPQKEELFSDYASYGAPIMSHIMWPKLVGEMDKLYSLLMTGEMTPQQVQIEGHKLLDQMMDEGRALTKEYVEKRK